MLEFPRYVRDLVRKGKSISVDDNAKYENGKYYLIAGKNYRAISSWCENEKDFDKHWYQVNKYMEKG